MSEGTDRPRAERLLADIFGVREDKQVLIVEDYLRRVEQSARDRLYDDSCAYLCKQCRA